MSEEKNNVMVLMPGDTLETIKGRFQALLQKNETLTLEVTRLREQLEQEEQEADKLREKLQFLRSTCPREREDGEPGFSQDEAYFWKNAAEGKSAEVKTLEAQVEQWKKKYQEKIFANE